MAPPFRRRPRVSGNPDGLVPRVRRLEETGDPFPSPEAPPSRFGTHLRQVRKESRL
ncbi:MAG: hypothetical protein OXU79_03175 [Gemmatimonadota bacterium]|nr:hypothetical protein [Gemmatimonadota bacterium]